MVRHMRRALLLVGICVLAVWTMIGFYRSDQIKLVLTAGEKGGIYYTLAQGIARVVQQEFPTIEITVLESPGSLANAELLRKGQADLAIVQNDTPTDATIRTLLPLHQEVLHFLVRRDADIHGLPDIVGHKIALGPKSSGTELVLRHLIAHYGLSYADFEPIFLPITESGPQLHAGQLDAAFFMAGMKPAVVQEILNLGELKLTGLGEVLNEGSEAAGFCLEYPYARPFVIPIGIYSAGSQQHPGEPPEPLSTIAIRSLLVGRADVPVAVIRRITQAMFRRRADLMRIHMAAAEISDRFDLSRLQFPLHPGARLYYDREKPSFLENHAESMGFLLSLVIALVSLALAIKQWAEQRKKNRIDRYYLKLDSIYTELEKGHLSLQELREIQMSLARIQHDAFRELIHERVRANEAFRIFQALLSDCQRMVQLKMRP